MDIPLQRKYLERPYDVATGQLVFPSAPNRGDSTARVVIAAPWATNTIIIEAVLNHDLTGSTHNIEEALIEGLILRVGKIVENTSVEVLGYAPNKTRGTYNVKVIGFS